jgi:hypothetical protein
MSVKTRTELKSENATDFPDNSARLISPADLRGQMDDVVDSMLMAEDDLPGGMFVNTGEGAVERSVGDRLADTVHLLDYIPVNEHAAILAGTSTYDASTAMLNAIASVTVNPVANFYVAGPEIILPHGRVRFNSPIQLQKTVMLRGRGTGQSNGGFGTVLEFATNTHGIIVHMFNTFDIDKGARDWDGVPPLTTYLVGQHVYSAVGFYECLAAGAGPAADEPLHASGDVTYADGYTWRFLFARGSATGGAASVLRDFEITSLGGTTGHGIWCRGRALVENVRVEGFGGHGLYVLADAESGGITEGNANNSHFSNMRITGCGGDGVRVGDETGGTADANACMFDHIDCSGVQGCGFNDMSFLGNTWIMPHTNTGQSRRQSLLYDRSGQRTSVRAGGDGRLGECVGVCRSRRRTSVLSGVEQQRDLHSRQCFPGDLKCCPRRDRRALR